MDRSLTFRLSMDRPWIRLRAQGCLEEEIVALTGASGEGKTTFLRCLCGLERPDQAEVTLSGRCLENGHRGFRVPTHHRRIGLVFQDDRLLPHLSVKRNLLFGVDRRNRKDIDVEIDLGFLGIGPLLKKSPGEISGGEGRRVALGRALLNRPEALLLDEPFHGLDGPLRERVAAGLRDYQKRMAIPMLIVSHDDALVRGIAHRHFAMASGTLFTERSPIWEQAL